jgi:hypothetical protein
MDRSLECRANIDFVLACLPWDRGCVPFVVLTSGLCAITAVRAAPPFGSCTIFLAPKRTISVAKSDTGPVSAQIHIFRCALSNLFSFWPVFIFALIINVHIARVSVFNLLQSDK